MAEIVVDALIGARYVNRNDFGSATSVVAEEIAVRLALDDYPPRQEPDLPSKSKLDEM